MLKFKNKYMFYIETYTYFHKENIDKNLLISEPYNIFIVNKVLPD